MFSKLVLLRSSLVALSLFTTSLQALGAGSGPKPTIAEVVTLDEGSAGDAIKKMWISHAVGKAKAHDLTQIELDAIKAFIDTKKIAQKNKKLVLVRYTILDKRVNEIIKYAVASGLKRQQIVTDVNDSMDLEFKEEEGRFSSRLQDATLKKDNASAESLDKFFKLGFSFEAKSDLLVSSQPLYRPTDDAPTPIMHEKELYMIDETDLQKPIVVDAFFGTANMSGGQRYNRLFQLSTTGVYQNIARYMYDHSQELIANYLAGKETSGLSTYEPKRFIFPDKSHFEAAFTDGVRNPNQRIADYFSSGGVKNSLASQFVVTNINIAEAQEAAMKADTELMSQGVYDQKFIPTNGWGITPSFAGYYTDRPMGKDFFPMSKKLRDRMEHYGYQRLLPGAGKIDPDGAPTKVHLWHDKTWVIDRLEKNSTGEMELFSYIFTGSLNASNAYRNAEFQVEIRLPTKHKLVQSIKDSILIPARTEKKYSLPLDNAIMRDSVARFLGKLYMDLTVAEVEQIKVLIKDGNTDGLHAALKKLTKKKSSITKEPTTAEVNDRIEKLVNFYDWYLKTVKPKSHYTLFHETFERMINAIATASATGNTSGLQYAIEYTIWWEGITPEEKAELAKNGLKEVFNLEYKPRAPKVPKDEKVEPKKEESKEDSGDKKVKAPSVTGGACDTEMKDMGSKKPAA